MRDIIWEVEALPIGETEGCLSGEFDTLGEAFEVAQGIVDQFPGSSVRVELSRCPDYYLDTLPGGRVVYEWVEGWDRNGKKLWENEYNKWMEK